MTRASAVARFARAAALLFLVAAGGAAHAATGSTTVVPATLNAVDFNFVGQANLGAPFQVDSGRIAEKKGATAAIRDYANLMVTSHIPVAQELTAILQRKGVIASNSLLYGAYAAMLITLKTESDAATFDRDYMIGQVEYQKANAALFRQEIEHGSDPDLKQFARDTLQKIEDHLQRAVRLAETSSGRGDSN